MSTNKNFQIVMTVRCEDRSDQLVIFADTTENAIKKAARFDEFCYEAGVTLESVSIFPNVTGECVADID